jgi:hypothetical protein
MTVHSSVRTPPTTGARVQAQAVVRVAFSRHYPNRALMATVDTALCRLEDSACCLLSCPTRSSVHSSDS